MFFKSLGLAAPSASSTYKFSVEEFKGLDKASGEDNLSPIRAVNLENFIRDKVGQVKKRGGFVASTVDELGSVNWYKTWDNGWAKYHGTEVTVSFYPVEWALAFGAANALGYPGTFKINKAIGEHIGEYFYLLMECQHKDDSQDAPPKYVVARINKSKSKYADENDCLIYELKVQAFENTVPAVTGAIGSVASSIVNAAMNAINRQQTVLPFMKFVPTPTIVCNASPNGGGSLMQGPNILSPYVQETFCVTKDDLTDNVCKRFQLSLQNISLTDGERVIESNEWMEGGDYWTKNTSGYRELTEKGAKVLGKSIMIEKYVAVGSDAEQIDYEWQPLKLSDVFKDKKKDFVNTESAALWIPTAAIGASPVEGEANVRITYIRNFQDYKDGLARLMACDCTTCFGVGGYKDRLFFAGENRIYYSGMEAPMYFGELCYVEPCSTDKRIVAMGGEGQVLYAVDSDGITHVISGTVAEDDSNTFLQDANFIIADRVQGEKPIGNVLKIFGGEFCYLSEEGVVAIRHDNFYDKRYAQNRSRMLGGTINGQIIGATVWKNFLVIATNKQLYLLDELQQTKLEDYKYSGVQYEAYPFTFDEGAIGPFKITGVWENNGNLCIQMHRNNAYYTMRYDETFAFDTIIGSHNGVEENIEAKIYAEWITPEFDLSDLHRKKQIQELWLAVGKEGDAVTVEYRTDNEEQWRTLRSADGRFIPFDYGALDYSMFSYNPQVKKLQLNVRGRPARPFYKIQFRFKTEGRYGLTLSSFGFYYKKEVI